MNIRTAINEGTKVLKDKYIQTAKLDVEGYWCTTVSAAVLIL